MSKHHNQRGAVSIFIVIFTALLVTIVTTGFVQIMISNQEEATDNDLSQSAYDAALAGVEDAKRALLRLKNCEQAGQSGCVTTVNSALASQDCDSLGDAGVANFANGEVRVGEQSLNQAYTCVKVQRNTPSTTGTLTAEDGGKLVHLKGESSFNRVRISWFSENDVSGLPPADRTPNYSYPAGANIGLLPQKAAWPQSRPSVLRAQLIQFSSITPINLSSFDGNNARTVFMWPGTAGATTGSFGTHIRRASPNPSTALLDTQCRNSFTSVYLCTMELLMPGGVPAANREAYLQLAAFYNDTSYMVELRNGTNTVNFEGVQPIVDSTGRASDLFRRVKARVSLNSETTLPNAALSLNNNLCKDFFITDRADDYQNNTNGNECDPATLTVPTTP